VKAVKLHVLGVDERGYPSRRTFIIREDPDGDVDIVEDTRPRCDADRTVPLGEDYVLEVESVDDRAY